MRRTLAILAAAAASLLMLVSVSAPTEAAKGPLRYVALGDSYSAASGVLPPDPTQPALRAVDGELPARDRGEDRCAPDRRHLRRRRDQGLQAAASTPASRPQLDALTQGHAAGDDDDRRQRQQHVHRRDRRVRRRRALDARPGQPVPRPVRQPVPPRHPAHDLPGAGQGRSGPCTRRAPHARVAILGYPWILPRTDGCFDKMPVAKGDVPYLRGVQATLNDAVRRAAAATGSTYVELREGLRGPRRLPGRPACAGSSRCSRAPTRSSSTRTRWARSDLAQAAR